MISSQLYLQYFTENILAFHMIQNQSAEYEVFVYSTFLDFSQRNNLLLDIQFD